MTEKIVEIHSDEEVEWTKEDTVKLAALLVGSAVLTVGIAYGVKKLEGWLVQKLSERCEADIAKNLAFLEKSMENSPEE